MAGREQKERRSRGDLQLKRSHQLFSAVLPIHSKLAQIGSPVLLFVFHFATHKQENSKLLLSFVAFELFTLRLFLCARVVALDSHQSFSRVTVKHNGWRERNVIFLTNVSLLYDMVIRLRLFRWNSCLCVLLVLVSASVKNLVLRCRVEKEPCAQQPIVTTSLLPYAIRDTQRMYTNRIRLSCRKRFQHSYKHDAPTHPCPSSCVGQLYRTPHAHAQL